MALEMKYFVLKPESKHQLDYFDYYALASRAAMRVYANVIDAVDKNLSDSLIKWVEREEEKVLKIDSVR